MKKIIGLVVIVTLSFFVFESCRQYPSIRTAQAVETYSRQPGDVIDTNLNLIKTVLPAHRDNP